MKSTFQFFLVSACLFLVTTINAQNICTDTLPFYLNNHGNLHLESQDFDLDTAVLDSVSLERDQFRCVDIGLQSVMADLYKDGVFQNNCQLSLHILDTISPVINVTRLTRKYIEAGDTLTLSVENLEIDQYDNCGIDTIMISPNRVDSSHDHTDPITITAIDVNGNSTTKNIQLFVEIIDCADQEFFCRTSTYRPNLKYGNVKVTAADLVSDRLMNCEFDYNLTWYNRWGDTVQLNNNTLTQNEVGQTLLVKVENLNTGESCGTSVTPENCYPFMEHLIRWPANLDLNFSCLNDENPELELLSPKIMEEVLGLDPIYYTIGHDSVCLGNSALAYNYEDLIIESDTVQKIIRRWSIIDWRSNKIFDNFQLIRVYPSQVQFDQLSCRNEIDFYIRHQPFREIRAEDVINNNGILICDSIELSFLDMGQQPLQLPGNRIYADFEDPFLYVISHALNAQESCTTKVNLLIGPVYCWERFYICDELPRGQIFNNCDSGYSTEDHIEWPGDVEVSISDSSTLATPGYLVSHGQIPAEDAYPTVLLEACEPIHVQLLYQDALVDSSSNTYPKELVRTWTVGVGPQDTAARSWTYDQKITLTDVTPDRNTFKIRTASGAPLTGVQIADGFITDQQGEVSLDAYGSDSIAPIYTGSVEISDISIRDLQILNQALNKERYLTAVQRIAADANFDGVVDRDDLQTLYDYIFDGIPLSHSWVFVNTETPLQQMDSHFGVSSFVEKVAYEADRPAYEYIGIRIGDIDFSEPEDRPVHGDTLTLQYEDQYFEPLQIVEVPVSIVEDVPLISLQFTLNLDPDALEFMEIEGVGTEYYNLTEDSLLRFSWNETGFRDVQQGRRAPADLKPMFIVRFRAKAGGQLCDHMHFDHVPLPRELIYFDQSFKDVTATFTTICDGEITSAQYSLNDKGLTLFPNPATHELQLLWESPLEGPVQYKIRDIKGMEVRSGWIGHQQRIAVDQLDAGMYMLEVFEDENLKWVKKFVVQ